MYISKLTLFGFKSFAKKTELVFSKGIASIVGPNGCGKTNILDAIRWVIGEQKVKTLRLESMTDVIFNGTKNKQPLGMAEVILQIKDCKGLLPYDPTVDSVSIGRRLYRSGESEYLINGRPVRLKDIHSILMGTGIGSSIYSLIELSMIQKLVSGGIEDRRELIEEAAGIMKYKLDRKDSESKLQSTENDLSRLEDIIREVETSVSALKRQMRRAKEFEKMQTEAKNIALRLLSIKYKNIIDSKNSIAKVLALKEEELAIAQSKRSEIEAKRQVLSVERDEKESEVSKCADKLRIIEQTIAQKEKEYAVLEERLSHAKESIEKSKSEITDSRELAKKLEVELKNQKTELSKAEKAISELKKESDKRLEIQNDADKQYIASKNETAEIRARFHETRSMISSLSATIEADERQIEILSGQLIETVDSIERVESEANIKKSEQEKLLVEQETSRKRVQSALSDLTKIKNELEKNQEEYRTLSTEINTRFGEKAELEGKLKAIEGSYAPDCDFSELMKTHKASIVGRLSELVSPGKLSAQAMDRILGDLSDAIVVRDLDSAGKIIRDISRKDMSAILIVLDELPEPKSKNVKIKPGAEKLNALFDDYVIGSAGSKGDKVVSAEGDFLKIPGFMKIGKPERKLVSLAVEKNDLENSLEALEKKLDEMLLLKKSLEEKMKMLEEKIVEKNNEYESILKEQSLRSALIERNKFEIEYFERQIETARKRSHDIENDRQKLIENHGRKKLELVEAQEKERELEKALRNKELAETDAEGRAKESAKKLTEIQMSFVQMNAEKERLTTEISRIEMQISEAKKFESNALKRIADFEKELASCDKKRKELSGEIEKHFKEKESAEESFDSVREKARKVGEEIRKYDLELRDANNIIANLEKMVHEKNMEKHDAELQATWIKESALSDYNAKIEDIEPGERMNDEETRKAQIKLDRIKQRIAEFGGVNMEAETEYEEQKKRLDFLTSQRDDLLEASSELKKTIKKLDNVAREQFMKTFEETRRNFKTIFVELFEGGEADLKLSEGEDVLEADIEIHALPRGKKTHTNQLSTGEKALCALALLFGLYMVKPSPFCMLDEVDAPLDDANVVRFANMLRRFSTKTQFILISHNKKTMEVADYLYGITMQEDGLSKVISLKMSDLSLDLN